MSKRPPLGTWIIAALCGFVAAKGLDRAGLAAVSGEDSVVTLYRGELHGNDARIHVATFDVDDGRSAWNRDKCEKMRAILQGRSTPPLTYWCEAGRYRR